MSLIYQPSGKAREYSPLALNVYTRGCDHQCTYCYCRMMQRANWTEEARPRSLDGLDKEAAKADRQIVLSFISDPYCRAETIHRNTRKALTILRKQGCSVAILTKGGTRCLDDLPVFLDWPDRRIKIGATLTSMSDTLRQQWEPGATTPQERIDTLKTLHDAGVQTWASIEPVFDAAESLAVIKASLAHVDGYKVGKLNHASTSTDWTKFVVEALSIIRDAGRKLYVKNDLRPFAPSGFISDAESNPETMFLPDRESHVEHQVMLFDA